MLACALEAKGMFEGLLSIVNRDMVWKLSKLQSVYNEPSSFNVEMASLCTNFLNFC